MTSRLIEHRKLVVAIGLIIGLITLTANFFVPTDFARDQLPWMLAVTPMFLVGALLVVRVPTSLVGWLLFIIAVVASFGTLQGFDELDGSLAAAGAGLSTFAIALLPALLLVFPDGSLPSRRWRPAVALVVSTAVLGGVNGILTGGWGGDPDQAVTQSPLLESTRSFTEVTMNIFFPLFALSFFTALASLVVRYVSGSAQVRHQLKWLLSGCGFLALTLLFVYGTIGTSSANEGWTAIALAVGIGSVPISIGIAVLRYRLYDIDVIISKSVTYLGLAAAITALYATVVVVPLLIIGETDDGEQNLWLPIVATAVVAVLFEPIRARMQRWANRLVYGQRSSPHEVLSQVTTRLSESGSGGNTVDLARLVAEGTGAEQAVVWLRNDAGLVPDGVWSPSGSALQESESTLSAGVIDDEFTVVTDVRHGGELLGEVSITKPRSDPVTPADRELVADVAAGAGLLLRNMRLNRQLEARAREVRESRHRLIAAQDTERHRLERDLHDGAQQQVVALKVKLGIAEKLADRAGVDDVASVVSGLAGETQQAVDALRAVAHGIYPPLLGAEGLEVALLAMERTSSVDMTITTTGLKRYDRQVEQTVYFCVLEAVDRIHMSGAAATRIGLRHGAGELEVVIDHDGRVTREVLAAMSDRVDAFEGTIELEVLSDAIQRIAIRIPAYENEMERA